MKLSSILRPSCVLAKARSGDLASCIKLILADPRGVEMAGIAGFDAVWLCNEHTPNDPLNLENQVRAAALHGMDAIVRVRRGSYSDHILAFELGAQGVMVPHVRTAAEAREVVEWLRFSPLGKRAIDGGGRDGCFAMISQEDYISYSNSERFIILQIETPQAVENIGEIAAVPGYEFLMFGPGDFAHCSGHVGQIDHPEVVAARRRVEEAAAANGKWCVGAGVQIAEASILRGRGYRLINTGSDVRALAGYHSTRLAELTQALEKEAKPLHKSKA